MGKKNALFPLAYDEISLVDFGGGEAEDGSIAPSVLIMKRDGGRSQSNPCSTKSSSTGAKETDSKKKSKRGKNWKEERHPRDEKGRMTESSSESKQKHGKGGTTKSKMDKECRDKKGGKGGKSPAQITSDPEGQAKIRRRRRKKSGEGVQKSAMSSWDKSVNLINTMERKAHNGR